MVASFFTYLKYLISGDSTNLSKLKELKRLYKTFKPSKYRYITKEKIITNTFLQKIYLLYSYIIQYNKILDETLFNKDENKSLLFLNHFMESYLTEDLRNKREKFSKEAMWERVMESENPSKVIKDIENEFIMYKNVLTRNNMPRVEGEYYLLYKLNTLATFNFELFFSKFQSDYIVGTSPVYSPINGEDILNDLKDLYFLIGSIPQKADLTSIFTKLFSLRREDFKALAKSAQHAVNSTFKLISDEVSPQIILALCRYISENIKLKINIDQKTFSIIEKYKQEIESRFNKSKNFVVEKFSEKSLQQDVHTLFKGKPLLKLNGYSDDLLKTIQDCNFEALSGIQALRITKTFILEVYEPIIREIINTLIIEAFFEEREYQTEFSNVFFAANELKTFILGVEENLSGTSRNSFSFLETLLKNYRATKSASENKILSLIEILNQRIKLGNEKSADILFKLATHIFNVIQDFKSQKPAHVTNIKTIKGAQNREFINQLAASYNDIAKYIKIIKNFVAVDSAVKKQNN